MKEQSRDHTADYQLASAVARYVELRDVRLTDVQAHIHASHENVISSHDVDLRLGKTMSFSFVEKDRLLVVEAKLKTDVLGQPKEQGNENLLIDISCTFVLEYWFLAKGGPEGDEQVKYFDAFANVNGLYNVWPYYRELVQSFSSRMSIPPIVVPVYRVPREQPKKDDSPAVSTVATTGKEGKASQAKPRKRQ